MGLLIKFSSIVHLFIFTAICGAALSYSNLYLFHIVMGLMFLSLLLIGATKKRLPIKTMPNRLHYFFVFMLAYYTLTLLWTISPSSTLTYMFYIVCGGVLAVTVIYYGDNEESLSNIFKVSGVAFLLQIFFCILEVYTPFRLPVSPFSSYLHLFGRDAADSLQVVSIANKEDIPTGFQWNPNNLATTMGLIFPFFLFHKRTKVKWLGILSVVLIINATGSRANLLAVLIMVLASLLFYNKRKLFLAAPILLSLYFFIPSIAGYLQNNFYNSSIGASVTNSVSAISNVITGANERGDSIDVRKTLIRDGLQALGDSYGVGVGGGASGTIHSGFGEHAAMHNFWIELLVDGGVLFFLVFAIWYSVITLRLLRISYRSKNNMAYYASASCISMIGFIPGAISASSTIYLLPMWLMLGFGIAVINTYYKSIESQQLLKIKQAA